MRQLISALALCAGAAAAVGPLSAQQAPAEFDPADFGKIVIQPRQSAGGGGLVFEQAFGDYQNEPIIKYGEASPIVKLGRPIGRLDMLFQNGKTGFCTAFIVDDQHILTNHHCIPGMDGDPTGRDSGVQAAQFVAGFIKPGSSEGVDRYTVSPQIIETNRELDYTVLRVFGNPSTKYGMLKLAEADPQDSEFLWIIGHPQGQAQHISREGCAAAIPAISAEGKLMHSCDTLGGNSGSPVIRLSDNAVVGLHHAGDSRTGYNMAIPMTRILPQSRVLKATADGGVVVDPGPKKKKIDIDPDREHAQACSAMWAEAKILGCSGYEVYASECSDHTFAPMAQRIIERECGIPDNKTVKVDPPEHGGPVLTVKASGGDYSDLSAAVSAAEPGTRIEVYPGTYTTGIDVSKPLEIIGVGNKRDIVLKVAEDNAIRWTAESGRVANLSIHQDGGKFFNFHVAGGSVIIENNDLTSKGLAVLAIRANQGATVRNNVIHDGAQGGIFMFESGKASIEGNTIFGNSLAGLELKEGADPIVSGNTFRDGGGSGIFINEGGKGRFEGNTIFNNALSGIEVKAADNPLISGNTIRDGKQGGIMASEGTVARITKNEIYGNAYAGIEIKADANPQVYDNILRDGQQSGIYVHSGGRGVIENNEIFRNGFYGISVKGDSNPTVRDNVISGNVYEAIRIREGGGGTYERNDLSGNTAGTFRIEPDAGKVIRIGNIEGPGQKTKTPEPKNVNVLTVKASGGGDYSSLADAVRAAEPNARIEVYPGTYTTGIDVSKPLEIVGVGPVKDIILKVKDDNAIRWTAESGRVARLSIHQDGGKYFNFHVAGGSVIIEDNDLTSKGLAVLAIRANKGATVRRNVIHDGAQGGIFMFEAGKATIEGNTIFGNSLAGLELKEGADPTVKDNTFRDGGGSGIFINEGGKGRFEGNTIFNNALSGIEVKAADDPLISGNTVRDGQQGGIMASEGSIARITKNEIYGNAYAGIEIKTNANPQVFDNILRDGQQSGIYVHSGGRGVIENNEIFRNGFYGLSVKGDSTPLVRGNKIFANVYEAIRIREGGGGTYENNDLAGNTAGTFRIEADAGNVIRRGNKE
ncbi:right-handed parallel beta-helix repeat-containing protein [Mameliella sediminis]|uniref:right-handed parallel beta-helix repeat-containing protein n=1 Tax=Mameliella sediminis TaxID=2836866 RepID=UPI001C43E282|nr:right-handed parallel beta-helix repeat-containing protein [Mameliella sediminis]MBV7393357.1 right-handed parallel beta-helix repeat-containing protein [Mameliella sediminis]